MAKRGRYSELVVDRLVVRDNSANADETFKIQGGGKGKLLIENDKGDKIEGTEGPAGPEGPAGTKGEDGAEGATGKSASITCDKSVVHYRYDGSLPDNFDIQSPLYSFPLKGEVHNYDNPEIKWTIKSSVDGEAEIETDWFGIVDYNIVKFYRRDWYDDLDGDMPDWAWVIPSANNATVSVRVPEAGESVTLTMQARESGGSGIASAANSMTVTAVKDGADASKNNFDFSDGALSWSLSGDYGIGARLAGSFEGWQKFSGAEWVGLREERDEDVAPDDDEPANTGDTSGGDDGANEYTTSRQPTHSRFVGVFNKKAISPNIYESTDGAYANLNNIIWCSHIFPTTAGNGYKVKLRARAASGYSGATSDANTAAEDSIRYTKAYARIHVRGYDSEGTPTTRVATFPTKALQPFQFQASETSLSHKGTGFHDDEEGGEIVIPGTVNGFHPDTLLPLRDNCFDTYEIEWGENTIGDFWWESTGYKIGLEVVYYNEDDEISTADPGDVTQTDVFSIDGSPRYTDNFAAVPTIAQPTPPIELVPNGYLSDIEAGGLPRNIQFGLYDKFTRFQSDYHNPTNGNYGYGWDAVKWYQKTIDTCNTYAQYADNSVKTRKASLTHRREQYLQISNNGTNNSNTVKLKPRASYTKKIIHPIGDTGDNFTEKLTSYPRTSMIFQAGKIPTFSKKIKIKYRYKTYWKDIRTTNQPNQDQYIEYSDKGPKFFVLFSDNIEEPAKYIGSSNLNWRHTPASGREPMMNAATITPLTTWHHEVHTRHTLGGIGNPLNPDGWIPADNVYIKEALTFGDAVADGTVAGYNDNGTMNVYKGSSGWVNEMIEFDPANGSYKKYNLDDVNSTVQEGTVHNWLDGDGNPVLDLENLSFSAQFWSAQDTDLLVRWSDDEGNWIWPRNNTSVTVDYVSCIVKEPHALGDWDPIAANEVISLRDEKVQEAIDSDNMHSDKVTEDLSTLTNYNFAQTLRAEGGWPVGIIGGIYSSNGNTAIDVWEENNASGIAGGSRYLAPDGFWMLNTDDGVVDGSKGMKINRISSSVRRTIVFPIMELPTDKHSLKVTYRYKTDSTYTNTSNSSCLARIFFTEDAEEDNPLLAGGKKYIVTSDTNYNFEHNDSEIYRRKGSGTSNSIYKQSELPGSADWTTFTEHITIDADGIGSTFNRVESGERLKYFSISFVPGSGDNQDLYLDYVLVEVLPPATLKEFDSEQWQRVKDNMDLIGVVSGSVVDNAANNNDLADRFGHLVDENADANPESLFNGSLSILSPADNYPEGIVLTRKDSSSSTAPARDTSSKVYIGAVPGYVTVKNDTKQRGFWFKAVKVPSTEHDMRITVTYYRNNSNSTGNPTLYVYFYENDLPAGKKYIVSRTTSFRVSDDDKCFERGSANLFAGGFSLDNTSGTEAAPVTETFTVTFDTDATPTTDFKRISDGLEAKWASIAIFGSNKSGTDELNIKEVSLDWRIKSSFLGGVRDYNSNFKDKTSAELAAKAGVSSFHGETTSGLTSTVASSLASNTSFLNTIASNFEISDDGVVLGEGNSEAPPWDGQDNFFPFTGKHPCFLAGTSGEDLSNLEGRIVISTGEYRNEFAHISNAPTIDESLPIVQVASLARDKTVFGVISKNFQKKDDIYEINSLGEGAMWVSDAAGFLENGDFICSSDIPGYGMKQDDDILRNYTVAKITQDCYFDLETEDYECKEIEHDGETYKIAFVGCTYHCG
jgi:hypothetical protein